MHHNYTQPPTKPRVAWQDHLLPPEYVLTMRSHMLDKCPLDSYDAVSRTVTEDLGAPPESLFASFEPRPIASASLAQVRWVPTKELASLGGDG